MPERPILLFAAGEARAERATRQGGPPRDLIIPTRSLQASRVGRQFVELARLLKRRTLRFQEDPTASHPSEIIVFELVGSARDFFNAIRRINGLQWLVDADIGEVPADNLFFYESDPSRFLRRRVLAVTANRSALAQLTALFRKYRRGEQLPHGFGVFNELFAHVREVRPWNFSDRTSYTGLSEYLQEQRALGANSIVCSLELF
jgi:hypothetical protein